MNDPQNKQMEQFRNRDTGDLHMYQDRNGQLWYMVDQIDDDSGIFVSAETLEGQPAQKTIKGLAIMQQTETIKYDEESEGTKVNIHNKKMNDLQDKNKIRKGAWKRNDWGCLLVVLGLIALCVWLGLYANNKKKPQPTKDTEQIKQLHNDLNDRAWRDYNRVIGLLSTKYSFSDSIVRVMILEYLRINEPTKYYGLTMYDKNRDTTIFDYILTPKESINVTIQRLNRQYGIRIDTISLVLFDFEIWLQTK